MLMVRAMGQKCLKPGEMSDHCEKGECRIAGTTRRRLARAFAKICHEGEYKNVWYTKTTKEAQCNATPAAASLIEKTLPADYNAYEWEMGMGADTAADRLAASSGQCFSMRRRRGMNMTTLESNKNTCKGVADGKPPVRVTYHGTASCDAANATSVKNFTEVKFTMINNRPAPCDCINMENFGKSECKSCNSKVENQCSTEASCNAARHGRCSWSGGSCSCKTGNYERKDVCVSGKLHNLLFQASSYDSCKKNPPVDGTYLKFPTTKHGQASKCQDKPGTDWDGLVNKGTKYASKTSYDCSGVADFGMPLEKFFNGSGCSGNVLHTKPSWRDLDCSCSSEDVESECRSCSGLECSTKDACTMAGGGLCAWNSASAAGSQCSCSSGLFESTENCWDGKPASMQYEGTNAASQCAAAGVPTFKRLKDVSKDESWSKCRQNWDTSEQGTHTIYKSCDGQANGAAAVQAFFNDASCKSKNHTTAHKKSSHDTCRCLLYSGCKAGTTFEKYSCAGTDAVTAVEYSDGLCKTATGVTRSLKSVTDAMNIGVCAAWPPVALKPDFDSSVVLQCPAKGKMVKYSSWKRSSDTMTPKCSPAGKEGSGELDSCYCKDEYMFNAIAKKTNVQISGDLTMQVSDVQAALVDKTFKKIVKSSVAESAGVSPTNIVDLKIAAARRLKAARSVAPRMLASGGIKATYLMVVPKTIESAVQKSMKATTANAMSDKIKAKVANAASVKFTATVTATSQPQSAPATVAVTTEGSVVKQGVDASGVAKSTDANAARTFSQIPSVALFMAITTVLGLVN